MTQDCGDGTTVLKRVTVIAGWEFESPDLDDVSVFATVRIQGFDCDGSFVNDSGSGPATYTSSASLQTAEVTGTIPLRSGAQAVIDVTWTATSGIETRTNHTRFPGVVGIFTSKSRDAVATGTVAVDGVTLVSGSTDRAEIRAEEDRNTTLP